MLKRRGNYKDLIFSNITDQDIYEKYFGAFELGKAYNSVLRKDEKASSGFYVSQTGKIIYNDFSNGLKVDSIQFVMKLFGLDYYAAQRKIVQDFNITKKGAIVTKPVVPVKEDIIINIVPKPFNKKDELYWNSYWINKRELERYRVYSVESTLIRGKFIPTKEDELKFAYILEGNNREYVKIYTPFSSKVKWISNCPLNISWGIEDITEGSTLVITKSLKDMIVLRKVLPNVIGLQNESLAAVKSGLIEDLKTRFDRIVVFFDNDNAGIQAAKEMSEKYNIEYTLIPERALKLGIKDPSDYIQKFGLNKLKELTTWLTLTS